jgi:hypothetical protein
MARGDHIRVARFGYSHHGIDCGDGRVVHFAGEPGRKLGAVVACTTIDAFARGGTVELEEDEATYHADQIVERALARLGEGGYSLFDNNCEHFARWCRSGRAASYQVRRGQLVAGAAGLLVRVAAPRLGLAGALGPVGSLLAAASLVFELYSRFDWHSGA